MADLSDVESVISELIDEYSFDDESASETNGQYDYDDSDIISKPALLKSNAIIKNEKNQVNQNDQNQYFTSKNAVLALESNESDSDVNEYEDQYDEYSTNGFDDSSHAYSANFEGSEVTIAKNQKYTPVSQQSTKSLRTPLPLQSIQLPAITNVSLQAELALDSISKEIVRLRNQQRNVLSQRRQTARDKKLRAESRRALYQVELNELRQSLKAQTVLSEQLSHRVEVLQRSLDATENKSLLLQSDCEFKNVQIEELNLQLSQLNDNLNELKSSKEDAKTKLQHRIDQLLNEKKIMREEVSRSLMMSDVVQKSLDINEAR